jgi:hypothetical protein
MVSVAARAPPVLGATLNWTDPLPLPLAPEVMVIHEALLAAVHPHPLLVETATGPPPPPDAGAEWPVGLIEYEHGVTAAAWLTVNVSPAIVSVPDRAPPVLGATLNSTPPLPLPLAPDVMLIQGAWLAAVHAHPLLVDTATGPAAPPAADAGWLVGLIENAHAGAAWLTVKVRPAMIIVPLRAAPVFAVTLNPTDPFPLPLAPEVTLIHDALLAAVHPHPLLVDTLTGLPAPAGASSDWLVGLIEYTHEAAGGAAWLTVKVWPATVSVPLRAAPVFAATLNSTEPGPLPLVPDVMLSHDALLLAVQLQPLVVEIVTGLPGPAAAAADWLVGVIEYAQAVPPAAAWLTVNVCPAMVRVPERAAPLFAATLNPTEPSPLPLAPDVTLIHVALLVAVHVQPLAPETFTGLPAPAVAATDSLVGAIVNAHPDDDAPAWLIVTASPATVSVPVRAPPLLAATLKPTAPLPLPLAPDVMVIHESLLPAVQVQPLVVETDTGVPAPAVAATDWVEGVTE